MSLSVFEFLIGLFNTAGGFIVGAAVLWALASGFFITNLSMELEQNRAPASTEAEHDLVTVIRLSKLFWSAVTLRSLKVEVFCLNRTEYHHEHFVPSENEISSVSSPDNRSLDKKGCPIGRCQIFAIMTPEGGRPLNLTPREETQYASYTVIPADAACEVIVTLTGNRYLTRYITPPLNVIKWLIKLPYRFLVWIWPSLRERLNPICRWLEPVRAWLKPSRVYWTASAISLPGDADRDQQPHRQRLKRGKRTNALRESDDMHLSYSDYQ
jgi:hypothetical protein